MSKKAQKKTIEAVDQFAGVSDAELIALANKVDHKHAIPEYTGKRPVYSRADAIRVLQAVEDHKEHMRQEALIAEKEKAEREAQGE